LNTLDFVILDLSTNDQVSAGFRVDALSGTANPLNTPTPEPSSLLVATLTFGLLGYRLRRKRGVSPGT
jgi:hypothetical protein